MCVKQSIQNIIFIPHTPNQRSINMGEAEVPAVQEPLLPPDAPQDAILAADTIITELSTMYSAKAPLSDLCKDVVRYLLGMSFHFSLPKCDLDLLRLAVLEVLTCQSPAAWFFLIFTVYHSYGLGATEAGFSIDMPQHLKDGLRVLDIDSRMQIANVYLHAAKLRGLVIQDGSPPALRPGLYLYKDIDQVVEPEVELDVFPVPDEAGDGGVVNEAGAAGGDVDGEVLVVAAPAGAVGAAQPPRPVFVVPKLPESIVLGCALMMDPPGQPASSENKYARKQWYDAIVGLRYDSPNDLGIKVTYLPRPWREGKRFHLLALEDCALILFPPFAERPTGYKRSISGQQAAAACTEGTGVGSSAGSGRAARQSNEEMKVKKRRAPQVCRRGCKDSSGAPVLRAGVSCTLGLSLL